MSKPWGPGQQAPLTPEYQAIFEANLKDQAESGQGTDPTFTCLSPGMPRMTDGWNEMEFIVTPDTTHILVQHVFDNRRIFTDGRDWPKDIEETFLGHNGRYDTLEVETRHFKGPRTFDNSGIPLHSDGQTVVKERLYLDDNSSNIMHDEVTVIDHALTRPRTVIKHYRREPYPHPFWHEVNCAENNNHHVSARSTTC
jgi:hypothetical protein